MEERHLSLAEVAELMDVSERTVRRWIKAGKLKAYKPGRDYRIPRSALRAFVEGSEAYPKPGPLLPDPDSVRRMPYPEFREFAESLDYQGIQDLRKSLLQAAARPHVGAKAWEEFAQLEFVLGLMLQVRDQSLSADAIPERLATVG
ncbi:MAG: helix-turn-helix domain-containing protein [Actinomycetota bacterium]|nr:helix-turn-helix domain-containing protein [Actinomycetota bacterium]